MTMYKRYTVIVEDGEYNFDQEIEALSHASDLIDSGYENVKIKEITYAVEERELELI